MIDLAFGIVVMMLCITLFYKGACWFLYEFKRDNHQDLVSFKSLASRWTRRGPVVTVLGVTALMTVMLSTMIVVVKFFPSWPLYQYSMVITLSIFMLCKQLHQKITGSEPSKLTTIAGLAVVTVVSTVLLVSHPNWVTINLSAVVMITMFMGMYQRVTVQICTRVAIGIVVFDIVAVFVTGQMVVLADLLCGVSGTAFGVIVIPQNLSLSAPYVLRLGMGDIAIPAMIVLAAYHTYGKRRADMVIVGYMVGLVLAIVAWKSFDSPQPATLYLIPTCFIGLWYGAIRDARRGATMSPQAA